MTNESDWGWSVMGRIPLDMMWTKGGPRWKNSRLTESVEEMDIGNRVTTTWSVRLGVVGYYRKDISFAAWSSLALLRRPELRARLASSWNG